MGTDEIQKVQLSELLNEGYTLGDRFKVVSFDIIPQDHLKQLDDEYNSDIDIKYKEIDQKYEKIVEDELYIAKEDFDKNIALEIEKKIKDKKIILENQLKADVEANNDLEVLTKIEEFKNNIKKEIYFSNIKCKNESNKEYQKRLNILCNEAYKDINIKHFYEERNKNIILKYSEELIKKGKKELSSYEIKKKIEIKNKYKADIYNEKIALKSDLDDDLKKNKEKLLMMKQFLDFLYILD